MTEQQQQQQQQPEQQEEQHQDHHHLHLNDFAIDPSLSDEPLFLPLHQHEQDDQQNEDHLGGGPSQDDIDAAIKATFNDGSDDHLILDHHQHQHQRHHHDSDDPHRDIEDDLSLDQEERQRAQQALLAAIDPTLDNHSQDLSEAGPSTLHHSVQFNSDITIDAPHLLRPPERDENTPHPESYQFQYRSDFEAWLKTESYWCHYVQRRVTNPEKRAEERLKARTKSHEAQLAQLPPEEAAAVPPLKRRRRNRTSHILEKVTYTCHHAGTYASRHSDVLPAEKLRLKTKKSVKVGCTSRIVMTYYDDGTCKAQYYWKHVGHDPFADKEIETGRMPKVVDDWLVAQISAGHNLNFIRKQLQISEEAKAEYIQKAIEDPSSVSPDMPPPIAFQLRIKYPDMYNRFRKLRGPVRRTRVNKGSHDESGLDKDNGELDDTNKAFSSKLGSESIKDGNDTPNGPDTLVQAANTHISSESHNVGNRILTSTEAGVDHQFGIDDHGIELGEPDHHNGETHIDLSGVEIPEGVQDHFPHLSDSQLAQALLQLPQNGPDGLNEGEELGHGNQDLQDEVITRSVLASKTGTEIGVAHGHHGSNNSNGNGNGNEEAKLREAVLRMARVEEEGDEKDEDWDVEI